MTIKQSEAERMLDLVAFVCLRNDEAMRDLSMDEAIKRAEEFARNEVIAYCEAMDIEGVDED